MRKQFVYTIVFLSFILKGCGTVAQMSTESSLILRDVLFDLEDRKELVKILPDASKIFYITGAHQPIPDNRIYYRNRTDFQREYFCEFSGAVGNYKVLNQSQLLVRSLSPKGQSIELYSLDNSSSTNIFNDLYKSIHWLAFSNDNSSAAFVAMPFNSSPIRFTYDFSTAKLDTLSNVAQGHYLLFFDENLNVIAGERIDQETGKKILAFFENNQWQEIETYEWSAERVLRSGLKSIVGVDRDGKDMTTRLKSPGQHSGVSPNLF